MSRIEVKNGQVLIDGKPEIVISGEVHYYRLKREEWQDRLTKLKDAGLNAVASYIPWLCHEEEEGVFDFGEERENLDVEAFIELCRVCGKSENPIRGRGDPHSFYCNR